MVMIHKIQNYLAWTVIVPLVLLLPYLHYLGFLEREKRGLNDDLFILEDISSGNLPEEVYFFSDNILAGRTAMLIEGRKGADIFVIRKKGKLYLGIKWIMTYPSDYFSDVSFYLTREKWDGSGVLAGNILTSPRKNMFVRYEIPGETEMSRYKYLSVVRNYSNELLSGVKLNMEESK